MRKAAESRFRREITGWSGEKHEGPSSTVRRNKLRSLFCAIPRENIRDRLLFNFMYLHGLRRGEAAILSLDGLRDGRIYIARA
jgi:integrase